ncbi:SIR2 family protein [Serratia ureilytica]|uniref:SIR2 family protein n=2 Tax=Serratia TaxID=613 RepID=UPI00313E278A
MDFTQALHWAFKGKAVVFLGAGFSFEARNKAGEQFPNGNQLAKNLKTELDFDDDEDYSLKEISDDFIDELGKENLYRYIIDKFQVSDYSADYQVFSQVPWRRLYTTNYDNVIEDSYRRNSKDIYSFTIKDSPSLIVPNKANCIHINGFVEKMSLKEFNSEFKLTETSYLTEIFVDSKWKTVFNTDLRDSKAIIFIGYSIYDIDIETILIENPDFISKTFFITEQSPSKRIVRKLEKYGTIVNIGVSNFLKELEIKEKEIDWESETLVPNYFSLTKVERDGRVSTPITDDVIDLFLYGKSREEMIRNDILNKERKYFIYRDGINGISLDFKNNSSVVIHSKMANGKTLFSQGAAEYLIENGYTVFKLNDGKEITSEEIEWIKKERKPVIIIENYQRNFKSIKLINSMNEDTIKLILTARTELHEIFCENLDEEIITFSEIDINNLRNIEIESVVDIFDNNGLFGARSGMSKKSKTEYIKNKMRGEFSLILADILDAPQIKERITVLLDEIKTNSDFEEMVILCSLSSYLNFELDSLDVQTLLNVRGIGSVSFLKNTAISQVLQKDVKGNFILKNPILAKHLLQLFVNKKPEMVLDFIVDIYAKLDKNHIYEPKFKFLAKDLNVYSNLLKIFGSKNSDIIEDFYDRVKNYLDNTTNQHFWLQYAIAKITSSKHDVAERFIETAYSLAKRHRGYNYDWINCQFSRLLIESAPMQPTPTAMIGQLKHAHSLIIDQNNRHYPFRVATKYCDFLQDHGNRLGADHKEEVVTLIREFYEKYDITLKALNNYDHPIMKSFKREADKIFKKR